MLLHGTAFHSTGVRFHFGDESAREAPEPVALAQLDQPPKPDIHDERATLSRLVVPPQERPYGLRLDDLGIRDDIWPLDPEAGLDCVCP